MPYTITRLIALIYCLLPFLSFSQSSSLKSFTIVPLGVEGGIDESNLSAYMVASANTDNYVCLDAGTLHYGIEKAIANKVFNVPAEQVLRRYIKGYFISHSHLDHLAGLIINSPDDTVKNIYALAGCIETFKTRYFTWDSWANFADAGEAPQLKKYHYRILTPDSAVTVPNTDLVVKAFPLSHSNLISTAFLLKSEEAYLLYLGDTGADAIEKSENMHKLWVAVAPLIKAHHLKGMMIEVSFPDDQPDKTLFGHLTPRWLMTEMDDLAALTGKAALRNFKLVITHVKPPQKKIELIKEQVIAKNQLGFDLIFPEQGRKISL